MARSLDQVLAGLTPKRRAKIERRASELATLKDLRKAVERTQEEWAARLGVVGTKKRQQRDIEAARDRWAEYKRRRQTER